MFLLKAMYDSRRAILALVLVAIVTTQTACPRKSVIDNTKRVISGLNQALPLLESAGVNGAKIREAVDIGNRLVLAFETNQSENVVNLASALITSFEGIITDTQRITNPATRTLILVILSVCDIALHQIADWMAEQAPIVVSGGMRGAPAIAKIQAFRGRKKWRCRNSINGQFAEMSFCKANPASSQVETYR